MRNISPKGLCWLASILEERFGHLFEFGTAGNGGVSLRLPGSERSVTIGASQRGLSEMDGEMPCTHWDAAKEGWISVLGTPIPAPGVVLVPSPLVLETDIGYSVGYDILGFVYWMLTRQEEIGSDGLDEHDRFPATASHAYKHGYLERPVVDEWLHILGQVIKRTWPQLQLKRHHFSMKVSHDVDRPSRYGFCDVKTLLRRMGGDAFKRGDYKHALIAPWVRLHTNASLHSADPYNMFDWIMDVSESHGLTSAFYFICGRTDPSKDADYELEYPAIRELMRRIHQRGHEIGLHPSYGTYQKPEAIAAEAERLKRICAEEGIEQDQWGGRMHYLRWKTPTTLRGWEQAGMSYDSSLGYADRPGFRCGTCFEYPAYDPVQDRKLALRIRPLIAMEGTVMSISYLALGAGSEALEKFQELRTRCMNVNGCFTLLWHNSEFVDGRQRELYTRLVG